MPLYYFECQDCKNFWEALISSSDKDLICPKCNSKNINKIFGKTNKIRNWNSSTPLDDDATKNKVLMRIPEYKDRNSGKELGMGNPEVKII